MPEFKETRSLIVKLLRNLGSKKEVEQYLKEFSTVEARKFAVVKVGGGVVRDDLDALASALSFLQRVGLYPIVIHGAGPQLNAALEAQGLASKWEAGFRVTDPETLQVARKVFQRVNLDLVNALEDLGTRATPIISGVFEAELLDEARYGLVGDITRLHLESIHASIERGALPILASLGETPDGQIVNINADVAANQLAEGVEPYKIVFLTPTGGIYDDKERVIPSINLSEDFDHLMSQPWLHSGMRVKLQEVHDLLMKLPYSSSVSITQPSQLAKELFTHYGSGTLIRRGERIICQRDFEGLDTQRIADLLASCFGRRLVDDYFTSKDFYRVYVTEGYRGVAILTCENGVPYLDKFGVTRKAQGEGLGRSLWLRMWQDNPALFWRARSTNPINPWYFQQAEGTYRSDPWTVFWYGIHQLDEAWRCVGHALGLPPTLVEHAVSEDEG